MITYAGISDQGNRRFRNEDFIAHLQPEDEETCRRKGALFVVCDGVGGSGAGDVASREAAAAFVKAYFDNKRPAEKAIRDALTRANLEVYDLQLKNTSESRMQTTLSAIAIVGNRIFGAHIGDSRIYRIRRSPPGAGDSEDELYTLEQLSQDHSEVGELVKMQIITPEMARSHPRRNIITRSLGSHPVVRGQFLSDYAQAGDIYLICTDGLWEPVADDEIASITAANAPEDACRRLVDLANHRGVADNVSVQIIHIDTLPDTATVAPPPEPSFLSRLRGLLRGRESRR
jgi:protein phosphatase